MFQLVLYVEHNIINVSNAIYKTYFSKLKHRSIVHGKIDNNRNSFVSSVKLFTVKHRPLYLSQAFGYPKIERHCATSPLVFTSVFLLRSLLFNYSACISGAFLFFVLYDIVLYV